MMHSSSCTAMVNNVAIVMVAALAASLSLADAASSYRCTFEDSASLHGARRFTIRTRHRNRIMKVSAHREFVAQRWTSAAASGGGTDGSNARLFFSACSGDRIVDVASLAETDTFEICQAGYADRKLIYDSRLDALYVVPSTSRRRPRHHQLAEGVVYKEAEGEGRPVHFYIRPRDDDTDVIVVRRGASTYEEDEDHTRSIRYEHPQVVKPDTVSALTHALFEAHPED